MTFQLSRGSAPLLVSMPHIGTTIPPALRGGYVPVLREMVQAALDAARALHGR